MNKYRDISSDDYNEKHVGEKLWPEIVDFLQSCGLDEIWSEKDIADWVKDHLNPEDIFDDDVLDQWAVDSGYVKGEN